LPVWLFGGQIRNFWVFINSFGFSLFLKKGQTKFGFFWPFLASKIFFIVLADLKLILADFWALAVF